MLKIARSRTLALIAVPMLAAAGTATGVVLTNTSAHAAPIGFTYAVGINTGSQTIILGHLKSAVVQHNPLTVSNAMTPDETSLATADLGGAAKVGFLVTKNFDSSDKAASVGSLVQTSVVNAGLWVYSNGALCNHIQARPAFVASVDRPAMNSNTTAGVTESIQFVARSFVQIVPNTCPTHAPIPTTGTYWLGSIGKGTSSYAFNSILSLGLSESETATSSSMSPGERSGYLHDAGKPAVDEITFTHGIDSSDESLNLASFTGTVMHSSTWTFTQYRDGVAQMVVSIVDPMLVGLTYSSLSDNAGELSIVTIAFDKVTISYPGSS